MAKQFSKKQKEKKEKSLAKSQAPKNIGKEWFDAKDFFCALLLTVLILLVSVKSVSVDKGFILSELKKNDVYSKFSERNISYSSVNSNASEIIDYIALKKSANLESTFLNDKEKAHMQDVKGIFETINILTIVLFPLTLILFFLIYRKKIGQIYKPYILSFFLILFFVGLLIVLAMNFNSFFLNFHKVFFTNDLWLMNPKTDLIITMFPETFFKDAFTRILAYPAMISFFFFFSGMLLRKQERPKLFRQ